MLCIHTVKNIFFFSQRKWYLEKRQVPWLREILDVNKYHERRRKLYNKAQGQVTDIKKHCHKGVVITQYRWKRSIPSKRDMNVSDRTQCEGMRRIYTISVAWTVSVSCDVEGYINWMSINYDDYFWQSLWTLGRIFFQWCDDSVIYLYFDWVEWSYIGMITRSLSFPEVST